MQLNYDTSKQLEEEESCFTEEEKIEYNKILDELYKPTEINIFDLC